jgi:hypothetical protein
MAAALGAAVLAPAAARADVMFDVSGTAKNISGESLGSCGNNAICAFSGTLNVDVTAGTATAIDVMFPGLPDFNTVNSVTGTENGVQLESSNGVILLLDFTTSTPGSLVGFDGGSIFGFSVLAGPFIEAYDNLSGSIAPVPEPPIGRGLLLAAGGLLVAAKLRDRRRSRHAAVAKI